MVMLHSSTLVRYSLVVALVVATGALTLLLHSWLEASIAVVSFTLLGIVCAGFLQGFRCALATFLLSLPVGAYLLHQAGEFQNGHIIFAFFFVVVLGVLYFIRANDLSQKQAKKALETLAAKEEDLRTVIDTLPIGIFFADASGLLIESNQQAKELFGDLKHVPIKGYDAIKMWNKESGYVFKTEEYPAARAVLKGERIIKEPYEVATHQGPRSVLISAIPLSNTANQTHRALVLIEDITERQQALEAIKRAKEEAEAANLAKDRFLAVLSHELRTPLTPVLMLAESLEKHTDLPPALRMDASMIRRYVSLEARLIDDLLDLTRIEKGKIHLEKTPVDFREVIQSVVELLRLDAQAKEIGISVNCMASRNCVMGDRARLKQVVWNLLGNALKFTPPGGGVAVLTEDSGDNLLITIKDSGIGIPPQALSNIFEAFEQAIPEHRRFGGLGLGLAIARSLVELHGGEICAESEGVGRGSSFRILLPALDQPASEQGPERRVVEGVDTEHLRILLIEDHEPTAFVLSKLLRRRGHDVYLAASVEEALAFDGQPLDLLVSDIGLPDGTGIDIIRHFKPLHPSVRAIALSGFGMENDIEQSLKAGFDRHLIKPVDFKTLEEAIQDLFVEKSPVAG